MSTIYIIGLGNPEGYEGTRHNIGKDSVSHIVAIKHENNEGYLKNEHHMYTYTIPMGEKQAVFATSDGYMNASDSNFSSIIREWKEQKGEVVIIHDELDLPCGHIRISKGLGSGGHNGIEPFFFPYSKGKYCADTNRDRKER